MAEVSSRVGDFMVIKMGQTILISQCDTRMKIIQSLSKGALTGEQVAKKIHVSYSTVMDHMEFLEKLGVVMATLKKPEEGRRKIYFHLNENPLEGIEELFMSAPRNGKSRSAQKPIQVPSIEV
jgi:predicted transcriptional regulator